MRCNCADKRNNFLQRKTSQSTSKCAYFYRLQIAVASISTEAPPGSSLTAKAARAGLPSLKYFA